ncbi:MAG: hypothetical protein V3U78_02645, partial [Thiotrichaceae bacterium]
MPDDKQQTTIPTATKSTATTTTDSSTLESTIVQGTELSTDQDIPADIIGYEESSVEDKNMIEPILSEIDLKDRNSILF